MEDKIANIQSKFMAKRPELAVGDTVEVDTVIRDGDKKRIQKFKGIVISIDGAGISKTFTVRKISYGVGVEKILPLYSPNVKDIKVLKHGNVRRSKLYYLRQRIGKAALYVKPGKPVVEDKQIEQVESELTTDKEESATAEEKSEEAKS